MINEDYVRLFKITEDDIKNLPPWKQSVLRFRSDFPTIVMFLESNVSDRLKIPSGRHYSWSAKVQAWTPYENDLLGLPTRIGKIIGSFEFMVLTGMSLRESIEYDTEEDNPDNWPNLPVEEE